MADIRIINPIEFEGWDDMIAPLPGSSFFHTVAWAKVLSESYNYKPAYFTLFRDDKVAGLIPVMEVNSILTGHRGVSLPFTDFCEPIVSGDLQFKEVLQELITYGRQQGWKYLELRGGQSLLPGTKPSEEVWDHTLNLSPDENNVFSALKDSTRRNVKKAIKKGVEVKILNSAEAIRNFYRLNCITRKHHGVPPQPYHFFRNVYEHVIAKDLGFVSLAFFQGKSIAGNMYFHFNEKAIYKYGASDQRYQDLRASNLVMWESIKWYCLNGFEELHFGRTELKHQGLRQFKIGWGVQEHLMSYFRYDFGKNSFVTGESRIKPFQEEVFRNTPIPLLKILGGLLYGHMA